MINSKKHHKCQSFFRTASHVPYGFIQHLEMQSHLFGGVNRNLMLFLLCLVLSLKILKECPQLHKRQLWKELKPLLHSCRSSHQGACGYDALKLQEQNHTLIFLRKICKLIRWRQHKKVDSQIQISFQLKSVKKYRELPFVCFVNQSKLL